MHATRLIWRHGDLVKNRMRKVDAKDNTVQISHASNWLHLSNAQHEKFSSSFVEGWNSRQVMLWLEGIGECVRPWLGPLKDNIRTGKHLLIVDDDYLCRIGITSLGPRHVITQAIQVLNQNCYEMRTESLQVHVIRVRVACIDAAREMSQAHKASANCHSRSQLVSILNNLLSMYSHLAEQTKKMIFWLDRAPFDSIPLYMQLRTKTSLTCSQLLRLLNVSPKALFANSSEIINKTIELREQCEGMMKNCEDYFFYATSYIDRVRIKRLESTTHWGINLLSSYRGVHVVSEIKVASPADLCGKIDAGDEILMIGNETVVGWDLPAVAQRLGAGEGQATDLILFIKKRPRDSDIDTSLLHESVSKPRTIRTLTTLAASSQASTMAGLEDETRGFLDVTEPRSPIKRRRSSTFKTVLQRMVKGTPPPTSSQLPPTPFFHISGRGRRATVCGGSPPPRAANDDQHTHFDLLAVLRPNSIHEGTRGVIRRARTMRHQPDGYVRSFVDNQIVTQVDDDVGEDQLPFNTKCPTEFARIDVATPAEIAAFDIPEPKITDSDWSAPIVEPSRNTCFRAPMQDSTVSTCSLDSPSIRKTIDDLSWGWSQSGTVLASPSTSSINSMHSPVVTPSSRNIPASPFLFDKVSPPPHDIPCTLLQNKTYEGWLRRRKTPEELAAAGSSQVNKWPKCWMALKAPFLYIYPNQFSKKADMIISVLRCAVTDADLKTSKKYVFRIHRGPISYYFSCYTHNDMKAWMHKIITAMEHHEQSKQSKPATTPEVSETATMEHLASPSTPASMTPISPLEKDAIATWGQLLSPARIKSPTANK